MAGPADDGRANGAILDVEGGGLYGRLGGGDLGFGDLDGVALGFVFLAGSGAGAGQILDARELDAGKIEGCLVLLQGGLRLVERRFVRPGIDREEQVAWLELSAIAEVNLSDSAGNLRLNGNGFARHAAADLI